MKASEALKLAENALQKQEVERQRNIEAQVAEAQNYALALRPEIDQRISNAAAIGLKSVYLEITRSREIGFVYLIDAIQNLLTADGYATEKSYNAGTLSLRISWGKE